jgi:NitT/TauT family transport system permease protein
VTARLGQLAVVTGFLALWEGLVAIRVISPRFLPAPSAIGEVLARLIGEGDILQALAVTGSELLLAALLAVPAGMLVGFAVGESATAQRLFAPALYLLTSIPKSLFLPIFILALGVGLNQKVAFGFFQAFFVIAVATIASVQAIPAGLILVGRALRANRWQMYWHIYLPYMLPSILQGVRIGVIFAGSGILFAEMYVSRGGLGRLIAIWGTGYQLPELLAGVLLAGSGAILINEVFRMYERRVGVWRD